MEEKELIRGLKEREPAAIDYLYRHYHDRVEASVRRIIKDDSDVEEVVQDTFWTVYRKIDLFREDSALFSWMYRIAINCAKMKVRTYKRHPIPMEDDTLRAMRYDESMNDLNSRPDERLAKKEVIAEIQGFLRDCNETNRSVYMQIEVDGVDKEEVARSLDLTVPAVKTRLHRLRVGLKERLEPLVGEIA